jgi:hypothetical protein
MAITEHYVSSDGTDTWANSVSSSTPCSLSTALTSATAGSRVNIKAGTYSRSASDTPAASGSATQPIIWRGCDASWNPISPARNTGNLLLVTTNFPVIAYAATYGWAASAINYHLFQAIKFTGVISGSLLYVSTDSIIYGCSSTNSSTGASAIAIRMGADSTAFYCDAACDGGSGGATAAPIYLGGASARCLDCYVTASKGYGIQLGSSGHVVVGNVVYGHTSYGIYCSGTAAQPQTIMGNTIYGGKGIGFKDVAFTVLSVIVNNHVTDNADWGIVNLNASGSPILLAHNRTRDTSSGAVSWNGDWDNATMWNHVTTDTGGPETDYVNAAGNNFNLISGAPGLETGDMGCDIGALQRVRDYPAVGNVLTADTVDGVTGTCTLPTEANVWFGTGTYGNPGSPKTPTKRASSITNCSAGNIKNGVVIDDVTGTYGGGGGGVLIAGGMTGGVNG